ncbi:tRNA-modifying protein YgfZ [Shimia sp. SK013]|uniref:CAF17-like 4Fe-4S cluster assembly/insertion protein YgfZ n=1 Tax=Shimia sp. SK013 TaxID=1389006 RepID=UPI0006B594B2|nr:folate-binding protein YgfZ [Shimia sp. SK013]KPA21312.1 tRNA-modifying protein YgfZ [Shimia sp. SK013]
MDRPRKILRLTGADTNSFLQGLITNDLDAMGDGLLYAALLTPQGKYIADFFLCRDRDSILLDADAEQAPALVTRLGMYKLRADVTIEMTDLHLHRGMDAVPADGLKDPRAKGLGWRAYRETEAALNTANWTAVYVDHGVPSSGIELTGDSYILENGFERLNGVDFRKGCYVGQEVTARMKHKTELRKGLAIVSIDGAAPLGTPITRDGRSVGVLFSQADGKALAYLRFDRAGEDMQAGDASVKLM